MKLQGRFLGRAGRAGQTLVEVAIASVLVVVLFGAVGLTTTRGNGAYRETMSKAMVEVEAQRLMGRVSSEFLDANGAELSLLNDPPALYSAVEFARADGFNAGAVTWGAHRILALRPSLRDPADDIDNDSNGLVDECRLVLVPDSDGAPADELELGGYVRELLGGELDNGLDDNGNGLADEPGFYVQYDDARSTVTLFLSI